MINEVLNKLLNAQKISELEAREVFEEIFSGLSNDIQTASFITALNNIDLDDEIICAAIEASSQAVKRPYSIFISDNFLFRPSLYCSFVISFPLSS